MAIPKRGLAGLIGFFFWDKEHSSLSTPMWAVDPLPLLAPASRSPPFGPKAVSRPSILQVSLNVRPLINPFI